MTVKECYEQMGADYEGVLGRLRSEALIKKFAKKFLDDGSYASLKKGLEEQNGEEAFRAAHTLKGVCQNLGFDNLYEVSFDITEKLRGPPMHNCSEHILQNFFFFLFLPVKSSKPTHVFSSYVTTFSF